MHVEFSLQINLFARDRFSLGVARGFEMNRFPAWTERAGGGRGEVFAILCRIAGTPYGCGKSGIIPGTPSEMLR